MLALFYFNIKNANEIVSIFSFVCCSNFIYRQTNTANNGYAFYKANLHGMQKLSGNGDDLKACVIIKRIIYLKCNVE